MSMVDNRKDFLGYVICDAYAELNREGLSFQLVSDEKAEKCLRLLKIIDTAETILARDNPDLYMRVDGLNRI